MKRIFRIPALICGALAMTTGMSGCGGDGDDDNGGNECCTYTESYGGDTYTYTFCEDGTYIYTDENGNTYTYSWQGEGYTWDEIRSYVLDAGGSCN